MNHVRRRLLPPILIPNCGHNQSASLIIALTFLTKNVSNESAFLVQIAHPYQAFLRNHSRTNFRVPSALTMPRSPTAPISCQFLQLSQFLHLLEFLYFRLFLLLRLLLLLLLLRHQESHCIGSHNQRTVKVNIYTDYLIYE